MVNFSLEGKVALVTGAAYGIGFAMAQALAEAGAKIAFNCRSQANMDKALEDYKTIGIDAKGYICDATDEEGVKAMVADIEKTLGPVDILVNNAAVFRDFSDFVDSSTDLWRRYMDINIMGTMFFTRALLPKMIENSYGKSVNVASVAGVYGNPKMVHYSATKGAVIAMTKALAKEVIDKGINVNCISPGSVSEGDIDDVSYDGFASHATYIGRSGSHRENANLICFLASDEASYISGQNIQIDGCRKKQ